MNLEASQQEMSEREKLARKKRRQRAGSKRKRARLTKKSLLGMLEKLAYRAKARSKDNAWAIRQIMRLTGRVSSIEPYPEGIEVENDEPESKPESVPAFTGRDLGKPEVRVSLDTI